MYENEEGRALHEHVAQNKEEIKDKEVSFEKLLSLAKAYLNDDDCKKIRHAYEIADHAHIEQKRQSGEPYILHPIAVAEILAHLQIDPVTLQAALLHDVVEDTAYTLEQIKDIFGEEVSFLVDGVTKLNHFNYQTKEDQQTENYRKMFLAMAKDVRVVVIKLADRLHNMRTLSHVPDEKKKRIANETMEIFAPLAHRLGIFNIKWELEDLSFRYLEPEKYYDLVDQMKQKRQTREAIVNDTMEQLEKALGEVHIKADVKGRPKHFYSIYKKIFQTFLAFSHTISTFCICLAVPTPPCQKISAHSVRTAWHLFHRNLPRSYPRNPGSEQPRLP